MVIYAFRRGLRNRPTRGTFVARGGSGDCGGQVQGKTCERLELQQPTPQHGHRRHYTRPETENGRVSSTNAPR